MKKTKEKKVLISKEAEQQKKTVTDQQATRLLHRKKVEHEVKKSQLYTFLVKCQINTHGAGGDIQVKLYKIVYLSGVHNHPSSALQHQYLSPHHGHLEPLGLEYPLCNYLFH